MAVTAATMPSYTQSPSGLDASRYTSMTSSIASVMTSSMSARQQVSAIAKSYRQAVQLYLTRRLPEALSTIEPVITPETTSQEHGGGGGGDTSGEEADRKGVAPIAGASRGTRIKVWSFYLTFLNAVVELGPEEGKHTFGSSRWKPLVAKARDGSVWEEVVRDGYGGIEGDVDADVVVNLATLLLTHAPSQKLNQTRLENFLSATSNPTFAISSSQFAGPPALHRRASNSSHHNGTSTPRDLNTRLKLIELYTLHILPKNQEWQYAREFILMSEVLDDERKDAFLQGLHHLREESDQTARREHELAREQMAQLEARRREEEQQRQQEERERESRRREEEERKRPPSRRPANAAVRPAEVPGPTDHGRRLASPPSRIPSIKRPSLTPAKNSATTPMGLIKRAAALMAAFQTVVLGTAHGVRRNPMAYFRTMLFLLAIVMAFAREEVRERVKRYVKDSWEKVLRTVGMGVKVSYI